VFKSGDIVGLKALWWQRWMTWLTSPPTDRIHFLLLGMPVPGGNDWIIYESLVSRGVRVGRISWYLGQHAKVYRSPDPNVGRLAAFEASIYGRAKFDYVLILSVLWIAIKYWCQHGPKRIPYYELTDLPNRSLWCVELVIKAYEKYVRLVPEGIAATPSAIEQARLDGKLTTIFEGILTHEVLNG